MTKQAQKFNYQSARKAQFNDGGLRSFFDYRDLGIDAATDGRFHAQVIRARAAVSEGTGPHRHSLDFQMVYVLKGWARFSYEDEGEFLMEPGDCVLQPPGIRHELVACSEDMELLEITSPARFETHPA